MLSSEFEKLSKCFFKRMGMIFFDSIKSNVGNQTKHNLINDIRG